MITKQNKDPVEPGITTEILKTAMKEAHYEVPEDLRLICPYAKDQYLVSYTHEYTCPLSPKQKESQGAPKLDYPFFNCHLLEGHHYWCHVPESEWVFRIEVDFKTENELILKERRNNDVSFYSPNLKPFVDFNGRSLGLDRGYFDERMVGLFEWVGYMRKGYEELSHFVEMYNKQYEKIKHLNKFHPAQYDKIIMDHLNYGDFSFPPHLDPFLDLSGWNNRGAQICLITSDPLDASECKIKITEYNIIHISNYYGDPHYLGSEKLFNFGDGLK